MRLMAFYKRLTYLFLKEEELDKLTTVLECVRYGLPARETLTYIGGTAK